MLLKAYTKLTSDLSEYLDKYDMDFSDMVFSTDPLNDIAFDLNHNFEIQVTITWAFIVFTLLGLVAIVYVLVSKDAESDLGKVAKWGIEAIGALSLTAGLLLAFGVFKSNDFNLGLGDKPSDGFVERYTKLENFYNKNKSELVTTKDVHFDFININDLPTVYYQFKGKMHSIVIEYQEVSNTEEIVLSETELNPSYKLLADLGLYHKEYTIFIPKDSFNETKH